MHVRGVRVRLYVTLAAEELADAIAEFEAAYDALMRSKFASLAEWNAAAIRYRKAVKRKRQVTQAVAWEGRVS